jgi:hypothetical protein
MAVRWTSPHPPPTAAPATTRLLPSLMLLPSAQEGAQSVAPAVQGERLDLTCSAGALLFPAEGQDRA